MPKTAKSKYTKVNATPQACQVLNILAAERKFYVYEILDEVLRKEYPEYFEKINAETTQMVKKEKNNEKREYPPYLCCKAKKRYEETSE
jgi:beta-glucosidase/6-phospho-beta-glucosidase/beta-galactosidase